jgi:hypothetical protein
MVHMRAHVIGFPAVRKGGRKYSAQIILSQGERLLGFLDQ